MWEEGERERVEGDSRRDGKEGWKGFGRRREEGGREGGEPKWVTKNLDFELGEIAQERPFRSRGGDADMVWMISCTKIDEKKEEKTTMVAWESTGRRSLVRVPSPTLLDLFLVVKNTLGGRTDIDLHCRERSMTRKTICTKRKLFCFTLVCSSFLASFLVSSFPPNANTPSLPPLVFP